ncbi:MAG: S41 family peptidase, partial [Tepidisphaeraceae bacterium]
MPNNRERIAWITSIVLIAVLAFQIPGTLAQRDDDYAFVRTLVDIHRQVSANYVDPVDEGKLREGAIEGLLSELDPFSVYVPPSRQEDFDRMLEGSFKGVGIQLNQTEDGKTEVVTPIDGSPAFKAGVMAGDIILKVNGESIEGLRLPDIVKKISGTLGTPVTLTVRHVTGQTVDLTMVREEIVVPTVKGFARKQDNTWDYYISDDPKVAYMRITQFTPDTYDRVKEVLAGNNNDWHGLLDDGMKGLVLDLRFNPGGRLDQAIQLIDLFLDKGTIVSTKGRNRPENTVTATESGTLPYFPMIVLVNEHSASASEVVAGSLMDNGRA